MTRIFSLALLTGALFSLSLSGCQQQEAAPPTNGIIEANQAYLKNFGEPPAVSKGRGFARVGFLPLSREPEKVRAIPFYLFDERDQLRQLLERLTGREIILPPDSPLYQPFPGDLQLKVGTVENGTVTLMLSTQETPTGTDLSAMAVALTETSVQFPEIERVRILINGQPLAQMPAEGFSHMPKHLVPVEPPLMVMIAGMWEPGAEAPEEILIDFDRPVRVNRFSLFDASGKKVEGKYFTSAFDMAVVVHPENPKAFQEGTMLRAEWDVTDALGRSNAGANSLPLRRYEH